MGKDKLRLLHILPVTAEGIMSAEAEEDMRRYLAEGTEVVHRQVTGGAETIQCEYDTALSAPHAAELAAEECAAGRLTAYLSTASRTRACGPPASGWSCR